MSGIIKAGEISSKGQGLQRAIFNFDDMSDKAKGYLDTVRAEATKIIAQANHEANVIRSQAQQQGLQAAMQAAEKTIRSKIDQQMQTVLPAMSQAVEEIHRAKQSWLKHWEDSAISLAAAIAQRIVRRELTRQPDITVALIREALELATGTDKIQLHLNPIDFEALGDEVNQISKSLGILARTEVISDPHTEQGGCRVITKFGEIDQQIKTQIAQIERELSQT